MAKVVEEKPKLFPRQIEIGRKLYGRVAGMVGGEAEMKRKFRGVKYLVVVPPVTNLVDQTKSRLRQQHLEENVIMYLATGSHPKELRAFLKSASEEKHLLHVLIADECHWGLAAGGANDQTVNANGLLTAPNCIVLLVSATPFNVLTRNSRLPLVYRLTRPPAGSGLEAGAKVEVVTRNGDTCEVEGEDGRRWRVPTAHVEEEHIVDWHGDSVIRGDGLEETGAEAKYHRLDFFLRSIDNEEPSRLLREDLAFDQWAYDPRASGQDHLHLAAQYVFAFLYRRWVLGEVPGGHRQADDREKFWELLRGAGHWDLAAGKPTFKGQDDSLGTASERLGRALHRLPFAWQTDAERQNVLELRRQAEELFLRTGETGLHFSETDRIVRSMVVGGACSVVRLKPTYRAVEFEAALMEARNLCEWGGSEEGLAVVLDTAKTPLVKSREPAVERYVRKKDARSVREGSNRYGQAELTLEDIDERTLIILVQKGSFGDTLPDSLSVYDIRLVSAYTSLSTLIQNMGRLCKYRPLSQSPSAVLSRKLAKRLRAAVQVVADQPDSPSTHRIDLPVDRFVTEKASVLLESSGSLLRTSQPSVKSYDYDDPAPHPRRLLLLAEPQVGKTGAFMKMLSLLLDALSARSEAGGYEGVEEEDEDEAARNRAVWCTAFPYWEDVRKSFAFSSLKWDKYHALMLKERLDTLKRLRARSDWLPAYFEEVTMAEGNQLEFVRVKEQRAREKVETLLADADLENGFPLCVSSESVRVREEEDGRPTAVMPQVLVELLNWDGRMKEKQVRQALGLDHSLAINVDGSLTGHFDSAINRHPPLVPREVEKMRSMAADERSVAAQGGSQVLELSLAHFPPQVVFHGEHLARISVPGKEALRSIYGITGGLFSLDEEGRVTGTQEAARQRPWILTASYSGGGGADRQQYIGYAACTQGQQRVHVLLVRGFEFSTYREVWGAEKVIVELPDSVILTDREGFHVAQASAVEGGIGFARLFGQALASSFSLPWVWMLDDNVLYTANAVWPEDADDGPAASAHPCLFDEVFLSLESVLQDRVLTEAEKERMNGYRVRRAPNSDAGGPFAKARGKKSKDGEDDEDDEDEEDVAPVKPLRLVRPENKLEVEDDRVRTAWEFMGDPQRYYGVIGISRHSIRMLRRRLPRLPWRGTHSVYSFYLLNVKATVEKDVFYFPKKCWEDVDFNHLCRDRGLAVVRCDRFAHSKSHVLLQPRQAPDGSDLYRWNMQTLIEAADESSGAMVEEAMADTLLRKWFTVHVRSNSGSISLYSYAPDSLNSLPYLEDLGVKTELAVGQVDDCSSFAICAHHTDVAGIMATIGGDEGSAWALSEEPVSVAIVATGMESFGTDTLGLHAWSNLLEGAGGELCMDLKALTVWSCHSASGDSNAVSYSPGHSHWSRSVALVTAEFQPRTSASDRVPNEEEDEEEEEEREEVVPADDDAEESFSFTLVSPGKKHRWSEPVTREIDGRRYDVPLGWKVRDSYQPRSGDLPRLYWEIEVVQGPGNVPNYVARDMRGGTSTTADSPSGAYQRLAKSLGYSRQAGGWKILGLADGSPDRFTAAAALQKL